LIREKTVKVNEKSTVLSRSMECDCRRGLGLHIAFIDHLYTRQGSTRSYSPTANLHNSQINTVPDKSSAAYVFTSRSLVTASNSGDFSASARDSFLQTAVQNWLGSESHRD
jgi:hypothetical protein